MSDESTDATISVERIAEAILSLRGQRVILDRDLAAIFEVPTKRLNEAIRRNVGRFPADFMFQLTYQELRNLKSQLATSSSAGRRALPHAFTEHGAIQAANVLRSPRAVTMGIHVVRAFVKMRELLSSNTELERRFTELERRVSSHDEAIVDILNAIRKLMNLPVPQSKPIGFTANLD